MRVWEVAGKAIDVMLITLRVVRWDGWWWAMMFVVGGNCSLDTRGGQKFASEISFEFISKNILIKIW